MAICSLCGKEIKNVHYLNGKAYGYNCYKMELAKYKLEKQQLLNDEYAITVFNTIQVYQTKKFTKNYAIDFQKSILDQYNTCGKLTFKQLQAIQNSFNNNDWYSYNILKFNILEDKHDKKNLANTIEDHFYKIQRDEEDITKFINDESFNDVLSFKYSLTTKKERETNTKKCYYFYKDIDDNFIHIGSERDLEDDKNDEYITILKVVEL